jgi:putative ABC transport system permease protein
LGKARTIFFSCRSAGFFENYGAANRTVNIATQPFSTELYNRTLDKGISAMRIARGLKADQENDFEIYTNDSLKSAFLNVAGVVSIGAFVISFIALVAAGIGIMNIMLGERDGTHEGDWRSQIDRCTQPRYPPAIPR